MNIVQGAEPEQRQDVRRLFEEYAASLSFDLYFAARQELDGLPASTRPARWRSVAGDH